MRSFALRIRPLLACAALSGVLACDMVLKLEVSGDAPPEGTDLIALEGDQATRIYYQFIDEAGKVRFVESLELVPDEWRDRVGFVEMSTPPPMSPEDMKRALQVDYRRLAARMKAERKGPRIIMYSANWCGACRRAKSFMNSKGIDYEERNVDNPGPKAELIKKSGGRSIPVFDIDGRILKGFNPARLQKVIAEAT